MQKKGILTVNSFLTGQKYEDLYGFLCAAAEKYGITLDLVTSDRVVFPCGEKVISDYDFLLSWDKDLFVTKAFEEANIPVFNSSFAIGCCDDKALTALRLSERGISAPKTVIAPKTFSNIGYCRFDFLCRIEEFLSYPIVIKQRFGSFGAQVYLACDRAEAEKILASCGGNEVLFEEFIAESRGKDLRINVVGDKVCGRMLRSNENDFRSNITNGGKMSNFDYFTEFDDAAIAAAKAVGADFAGVDVLFGRDGPVICEVNASPHFKTTYQCTGVNLAEEIIAYICKKVFK